MQGKVEKLPLEKEVFFCCYVTVIVMSYGDFNRVEKQSRPATIFPKIMHLDKNDPRFQ